VEAAVEAGTRIEVEVSAPAGHLVLLPAAAARATITAVLSIRQGGGRIIAESAPVPVVMAALAPPPLPVGAAAAARAGDGAEEIGVARILGCMPVPPKSLLKRWVAASRKQGALLGEPRGGGGGGEQSPEQESEQWLLAWWRKVCCRAHARGAGTPLQRYRAWSLRENRLGARAAAADYLGAHLLHELQGSGRGMLPRSAHTAPEEEPTQGRAGRYEVRGREEEEDGEEEGQEVQLAARFLAGQGWVRTTEAVLRAASLGAAAARGEGGAAQKPPLWAPHEAGELFARPVAAVRQAEASMVAAAEAGAEAEAEEERPAPLPVAPYQGAYILEVVVPACRGASTGGGRVGKLPEAGPAVELRGLDLSVVQLRVRAGPRAAEGDAGADVRRHEVADMVVLAVGEGGERGERREVWRVMLSHPLAAAAGDGRSVRGACGEEEWQTMVVAGRRTGEVQPRGSRSALGVWVEFHGVERTWGGRPEARVSGPWAMHAGLWMLELRPEERARALRRAGSVRELRRERAVARARRHAARLQQLREVARLSAARPQLALIERLALPPPPPARPAPPGPRKQSARAARAGGRARVGAVDGRLAAAGERVVLAREWEVVRTRRWPVAPRDEGGSDKESGALEALNGQTWRAWVLVKGARGAGRWEEVEHAAEAQAWSKIQAAGLQPAGEDDLARTALDAAHALEQARGAAAAARREHRAAKADVEKLRRKWATEVARLDPRSQGRAAVRSLISQRAWRLVEAAERPPANGGGVGAAISTSGAGSTNDSGAGVGVGEGAGAVARVLVPKEMLALLEEEERARGQELARCREETLRAAAEARAALLALLCLALPCFALLCLALPCLALPCLACVANARLSVCLHQGV
jgi:hypothetical protein